MERPSLDSPVKGSNSFYSACAAEATKALHLWMQDNCNFFLLCHPELAPQGYDNSGSSFYYILC